MNFKTKGKVLQVLPELKGTSPRGDWKKQDFVIETLDDQYPKKVCFTFFNDKNGYMEKIRTNMEVEVSFSIESREFNEKWYTNLNAFRVDPVAATTASAPSYAPPPHTMDDLPPLSQNDDKDDLPF